MLQSPSFDLTSLDEFPLLNEKNIEISKKVNKGRKLPKTSWRKMEWQHLFHVCIMSLISKDFKNINSLGCVCSYWIEGRDSFIQKKIHEGKPRKNQL